MKLIWSPESLDDLVRIHDFLEPVNPQAATDAIRALHAAVQRILAHPRIGERLPRYRRREIRRTVVGTYEVRYEVQPDMVTVLRIFSTRERR
jgi:plasmid stabilization system protein ParE